MTRDSAFLSVLRGQSISPPPIWFMRQAGRYLDEYRAVRAEAGGFLDLCFASEKAARVTMQPIERFDFDAAILFADILLLPLAMGQKVWFEAGEGPRLAPPLMEDMVEAARLSISNIDDTLSPVYRTVELVRSELSPEKALIGFAGAPWTVATYMLAGSSVKDPSALRSVAYAQTDAFGSLIDAVTDATAHYLIRQIEAGADAIQIFDSWAAGLPENVFNRYCLEPVVRIAKAVKAAAPDIPVIAFPRGAGPLYETVASQPEIDAVSVDAGLPPGYAAEKLSPHGAVQGALDPLLIVEGGQRMLYGADAWIDAMAGKPHIFNIGHGLVPQTPPEHVAALINHIRSR